MNTTATAANSRLSKILFALPMLIAILSMGLAHAGTQGVEQLPRVVVAGKSLSAQAAGQKVEMLPRVVVHGQSNGYTAAMACADGKTAGTARAATQVC